MASRTKQKEEARARRLAEERAQAERARRTRRTQMLVGVLLAAVALVVAAIAISSSGGNSKPKAVSNSAGRHVSKLLTGIPQSGQTIGSPSAKVTVTEFGDLQCPICRDFALGAETQLIGRDVRSGRVKLVYKSLETASGSAPNPNIFPVQQAAAYAAGLQSRGWDYILLFYQSQGQEGTGYVTPAFLQNLAHSIPGLNYSKWLTDSKNPGLTGQVATEQQTAQAKGYSATPTLLIQGPKGQAQPIAYAADYGTLEAAIKSVE